MNQKQLNKLDQALQRIEDQEKMLNLIGQTIHNLTDLEVELQNNNVFILPMLLHLSECNCKDMIKLIKDYIITNK